MRKVKELGMKINYNKSGNLKDPRLLLPISFSRKYRIIEKINHRPAQESWKFKMFLQVQICCNLKKIIPFHNSKKSQLIDILNKMGPIKFLKTLKLLKKKKC